MSTFLLEIVTPLRVAYSDQVEMVIAPSASGVIGVLANHVPLFTRLVQGELKILRGSDEFYLAIGGGFMEVTKDHVTILVSRAVHAKELNDMEIKRAQERAREALARGVGGPELAQVQALMRQSLLELKVLRRHRPTHPSVA